MGTPGYQRVPGGQWGHCRDNGDPRGSQDARGTMGTVGWRTLEVDDGDPGV